MENDSSNPPKPKSKSKFHRETKKEFSKEDLELVYRMAKIGLPEEKIAVLLDMSKSTFERRKKKK